MNKEQIKSKRLRMGVVVSDKMDKTVVVESMRTYIHPRFEKVIRKIKKFKVHDPANKAKIGDQIEFYEGKPVSKTKYMYLAKVLEKVVSNKAKA